jgi:uncharacterized protein (DUF924 family)
MDDIDRVYFFWFGDAPAQDAVTADAKMRRWYMGGPSMDLEVREKFGPLAERAVRGELDGWARTPRGRIALILLLDQLTRNLWRDDPRCYAGDAKAQKLAVEALDAGLNAQLSLEERQFLRMPLAHAEDRALQERNVAETEKLVATVPEALLPVYASGIERSRKYLAVIARFGRFPHRNQVLGRSSTAEEIEFLKDWPEKQPPSGMRRQPGTGSADGGLR